MVRLLRISQLLLVQLHQVPVMRLLIHVPTVVQAVTSNSFPARSTVTSSTPGSSLGPINFAPIATGTNFNMNIPFEISKASDDISRNVPQSLKQILIAGEFIDLSNLLCNTQNSSGSKQTITIVQGQLVLQPKLHDIKINDIETWTDAFLIISVFIAQYTQTRFKIC